MGFIVLLPVLFLLVIGAGLLMALATAAHIRKRNPVCTVAWVGAGVVSSLALAFSLVMFFFGGAGSDADGGALDFYKTPLGGGFYLASVDSDRELPLGLGHRDGDERLPRNVSLTVTGLACVEGLTFLRFKDGERFGRIDVPGRRLNVLTAAGLPVAAEGQDFWLHKADFRATSCADVRASAVDQVRNALLLLAGPLVNLGCLIWLWVWGRRLPNARVKKEASW
ncbi:hypothetical protein [Deinococcus radiotolerans]|nr:hypothetical protein [Deinococcus radiotolerans]